MIGWVRGTDRPVSCRDQLVQLSRSRKREKRTVERRSALHLFGGLQRWVYAARWIYAVRAVWRRRPGQQLELEHHVELAPRRVEDPSGLAALAVQVLTIHKVEDWRERCHASRLNVQRRPPVRIEAAIVPAVRRVNLVRAAAHTGADL